MRHIQSIPIESEDPTQETLKKRLQQYYTQNYKKTWTHITKKPKKKPDTTLKMILIIHMDFYLKIKIVTFGHLKTSHSHHK